MQKFNGYSPLSQTLERDLMRESSRTMKKLRARGSLLVSLDYQTQKQHWPTNITKFYFISQCFGRVKKKGNMEHIELML